MADNRPKPRVPIPSGFGREPALVRPCCTEVSKGATAPSWNHLRNADEISLPEFAHSIERFDRDCNFGHTASVIARLQGISDDALVATDRRFNFRASVVASRLLPVHPPVRIDGENMLVSLGWRCRDRWASRATSAATAPGSINAETQRSFSVRDQRRRLSTDVMTSIRFMAPLLTPGIGAVSYGRARFGRRSTSGGYCGAADRLDPIGIWHPANLAQTQ
jgi:hypothetical protein